MNLLRPKSFFYKTLSIIALVSIGFQIIVLSAVAYYMLIPLGERATDDLSSVIVHAAERWGNIDADQRPEFSKGMLNKHDLVLTHTQEDYSLSTSALPYQYLLEKSLSSQYSTPVNIKSSVDTQGETWFWVDIPTQDSTIRFGFSRARIGVNPPAAFFITLIIGTLLTLVTTAYLTKRLIKPISSLYNASRSIGKGNWPNRIKEEGPEEFVVLTRQFNKMNLQVQALLSNRTTLLAGIAHDLRTPLTQINLALSMLPNNGGDITLLDSIQQDLDSINNLISDALNISLELTHEKEKPSNAGLELSNIVAGFSTSNPEITFEQSTHNCQPLLYPMAFKRILTNLITNAIRYGNNKPVSVLLDCSDTQIVVQVKDRGPGIPKEFKEKIFQPFYRLETSRNSATGGSGLGLAIVQQLVDSHNWHISLNPRKNGGTNAVVSIGV